MTTDYDSVDYFTDPSLVPDPHPYFDYLRTKNPVGCPINNGVLAVTGWEAANAVYKDTENYSSCVAVAGPFTPMPFVPEGDDICATARRAPHRDPDVRAHGHHGSARSHRRALPAQPAADTEAAEGERGLHVAAGRSPHRRVHRRRQVRVPGRVRQAVLAAGRRRPARRSRGRPRGVPRGASGPSGPARTSAASTTSRSRPTRWSGSTRSSATTSRTGASNPRDDVLTALATAKYPDGSTPEVVDVVRTATFLFAAGQETTAKLLSAALRVLGDRPDIQQQLREDRSLIPIFIEECLRMDSPVKSEFRMARKTTTLGDTRVPAGTTVMVQSRRRQPRSAAVRQPARVQPRPQERPRAHRVRPRRPLLPRRAAGPRRGPGIDRAHSRPDGRHHDRRGKARADRRAPLQLRADLHPARAHRAEHRVHARWRCTRIRKRSISSSHASCEPNRAAFVFSDDRTQARLKRHPNAALTHRGGPGVSTRCAHRKPPFICAQNNGIPLGSCADSFIASHGSATVAQTDQGSGR